MRLVPIVAVILLTLSVGACARRNVVTDLPVPPRKEDSILEAASGQELLFQALTGKMSAQSNFNGSKNDFRINVRLVHDSALWVSLTPALGIEAFRALITRDSVKYIDKLHKTYFLGTVQALEEKSGVRLRFEDLEDLLLGNPALLDSSDKFVGSIEDALYLLTAKVPRKLRRATDPDSTRNDRPRSGEALERRTRKARENERYSPEDFIVKRYWISPADFKPRRFRVDDLLNATSLEVTYAGYTSSDSLSLPVSTQITARAPDKLISLKLENKGLRQEPSLSLPFQIPDAYTRVQ